MILRREPFRLLFPLGVLLAWIGVAPWVLYGSGLLHQWLGLYHAFTMTEGFLVAIAAGFLGTLIPRRTGAPPYSRLELTLIVGGLLAVPLALALGGLGAAQAAYLLVLGTLTTFAMRRIGSAGEKRMPPSHVLLPFGVLMGAAGAALILAFSLGAPLILLTIGRPLVEEGLLFGLVLAVAPMLTPILCHGEPAPPLAPEPAARQMRLYFAAGLLLVLSFAIQPLSERAGMLLRGLTAAAVLWPPLLRTPTAPGLHRRLYRLALLFVPLGDLIAGGWPAWRLPSLHLTFIGGLSLLIFAVSLHVVYFHTGHESRAHTGSWQAALVGVLTVSAALVRASAEHLGDHYTLALAIASSLWITAALVWGLSLFGMIARKANLGDAAVS